MEANAAERTWNESPRRGSLSIIRRDLGLVLSRAASSEPHAGLCGRKLEIGFADLERPDYQRGESVGKSEKAQPLQTLALRRAEY